MTVPASDILDAVEEGRYGPRVDYAVCRFCGRSTTTVVVPGRFRCPYRDCRRWQDEGLPDGHCGALLGGPPGASLEVRCGAERPCALHDEPVPA